MFAAVFVTLMLLGAQADIFVTQQDQSGNAIFSLFNLAGEQYLNSSLTFPYPAPLIETTANPEDNSIYIIGFPTTASGASLFELTPNLNVAHKWTPPSFQFFDLQYCVAESTLFGIVVISRYGRNLSKITTTADSITYSPIATLPYMWYVNASTFDQSQVIYYGLLNNFPGQPNSTIAQKLAIGRFGEPGAPTQFVDLALINRPNEQWTVHFIAWSITSRALFGLAQGDNTVALVRIDLNGGVTVVATVGGYYVGPIAASYTFPGIYCFLSVVGGGHVVALFETEGPFRVLKNYDASLAFATATMLV